jgi:outer membrane lipoprotein-sorting protein
MRWTSPTAILLATLGLVTTHLTACGGDSGTLPDAPRATPTPEATPYTPSGEQGSDPVRALIMQARSTFATLPGYKTELDFYQKYGNQTASGIYDVQGKPPRRIRIDIRQGTGQGTKLYWDGGPKVHVRPDGLLGAITVDLDLKDDRVVSIRGYAINQTDLGNLLDLLADPRGKVLNAAHVTGAYWIRISGPQLLKGCQDMTVAINDRTLLPDRMEMTDGRETVFRIVLKNAKITPDVSLDI